MIIDILIYFSITVLVISLFIAMIFLSAFILIKILDSKGAIKHDQAY